MHRYLPAIALFGVPLGAPAYSQSDSAVNATDAATDAAIEAAEEAAEAVADAAYEVAAVAEAIDAYPRNPRPVGSSWTWITTADYPPEVWRQQEEGLVEYDIAVDADGKAQSCAIRQSSGFANLDTLTCSLIMERAEFRPALDENGSPVTGTYSYYHRWERREPEFPSTFLVKVEFVHDETGAQVDCKVVEVSGEMSEDMRRDFERRPCPARDRNRGIPYRDDDGNPVAKKVILQFGVELVDVEQ